MSIFNNKSDREKWKDISAIFTPWLLAAITVGGGGWFQWVTSARAAKQKSLELAIGVLRAPPAVDGSDKGLRDWATREVEQQTRITFTPDARAALKANPGVFTYFPIDPDGELTYSMKRYSDWGPRNEAEEKALDEFLEEYRKKLEDRRPPK